MVEDMEELEEQLSELLGDRYQIDTDADGQLLIYTGLKQNENGELEEFLSDEDVEEDLEIDPDQEPLDLDDEE